jgi:hypothetical protein
VKNVAEATETCGVYTVSWRSRSEPQLACHWTYCLSSDEMQAAMTQTDDEGAPIVIRSAGWLSVDDMLVAS